MPLPFFAAQEQEKPGLFRQSPPGTLALCLSVPETAQPIAGVQWGRWAFPYRLTGSGEAERGFSARAAGGTCFMALRPGNRTAHRWGAVGALALSHHPAGSRKAEGLFRQRMPGALALPHRSTGSGEAERAFPQSPPGTLFYGSLPRNPHSPLPGRCGAMDASASHRREWEPCHKRKKRRKFPPLF